MQLDKILTIARFIGRAFIVCAVCLAGPGCQEKGPPPTPEALARLLPRVSITPPQVAEDELLGGVRVMRGAGANEELAGFTTDQPGGSLVSIGTADSSGSADALCVSVKGTQGVGISVGALREQVPEALKSSNVIRAVVYCPGSNVVVARAELRGGDGGGALVKGYSQWVNVIRQAGVQVVDFTLIPPADVAPGDRLTFQFSGGQGLAGITEVQFLGRPAAGLKAQADAPVWTARPNGSCLAAGLVEGHRWEATVDVGPTSELVLWYSVPDELKWLQTPATRVDVRIKGDGGRVKHSFEASHAAGWTEVVIPLDDIDPCTAVIRFSVHEPRRDFDGIVLLGDVTVRTKRPSPKTMVLITSDTHRVDYLGSSSQTPRIKTPAIDALARRGMQYDNAFTTTNVTSPSHVAIMTGLHPKDTGVVDNFSRLADRATTLAETLAAAGYRTLAVTSAEHLSPEGSNIGQGFDRFSALSSNSSHARDAVGMMQPWVDDADGTNLFVWLHLFDAHTPYWSDEQRAIQADPGPERSLLMPEQLDAESIPWWLAKAPATGPDEVRAWYGQEVVEMDRDLRAFLEQPRFTDAWMAFTSDHGENLGEHRSWFRHAGLYQPVMYVPLILAGPGVPVGRSEAPVLQSQLASTLLKLAGVSHDLPGEDLLTSDPEIEQVRFGLAAHGNQASISLGHWLLVLDLVTEDLRPGVRFYDAGRVQLFDLRLGLTSEENFFLSEPDIARQMVERLIRWLDSPSPDLLAEAASISPAEAAQLRQLGYASASPTTVGSWWRPEKVSTARWLTYHGIQK